MSTPAPPTTSHTNPFTSDDAAVERLRIDLLGKGEGVGKAESFDRQIASGVLDFLADGDTGVALVKAQPEVGVGAGDNSAVGGEKNGACSEGGKRTGYEVYEERYCGRNVSCIDVDMRLGETKMWLLNAPGG